MFLPIGDNIERRTFPIVPALLIMANVMGFALETRVVVSNPGDGEAIFRFVQTWGLVPADLAQWKVIGVLTHMFLHGGLLHLIGNMVVLWAFACSLEVGLGKWTLLGFYLLFGVVGGLTHAFTELSSEVPLVGASGAIAGLIGAYTVLFGPLSKIRTLIFIGFRPLQLNIPAGLFGFGWFMQQIYYAGGDADGTSGVAWYAHIGGFLAGAITMYICRGDAVGQVTGDGSVYLVIDETVQPAPDPPAKFEVPAVSESATTTLPGICPYCEAALDEQHRQGASLARCGNPECGRLVVLDAEPAVCVPVA